MELIEEVAVVMVANRKISFIADLSSATAVRQKQFR
jgi:hypothetical protein